MLTLNALCDQMVVHQTLTDAHREAQRRATRPRITIAAVFAAAGTLAACPITYLLAAIAGSVA